MGNKRKMTAAFTLSVLLLVLWGGAGGSLAYFTDQASAEGGWLLEAGEPDTEITERFSGWTKYVSIGNTGDIPLYIRVRAYCGSEYSLEYTESSDWTKRGDWYYYIGNGGVLETAEKTPELPIMIKDKDGNEIPAGDAPEEGRDRFNVAVVWERLALQYDREGNLIPSVEADWDRMFAGGDEP